MTGMQDTQQALADIDRKLRELQRALVYTSQDPPTATVSDPGPEPAPSEPAPSEPARSEPAPGPAPPVPWAIDPPPAPARASAQDGELVAQAGDLAAQLERHIGVLQALQSELERSTRELAEAFRQRSSLPAAEPAFQGVVTIDVGPFADIGTLGTFEHVLASLGVAEDVYVRSYEGSRAVVHVRLDSPTELVGEMRRGLPFPFEVTAVSAHELTLQLLPEPDDA